MTNILKLISRYFLFYLSTFLLSFQTIHPLYFRDKYSIWSIAFVQVNSNYSTARLLSPVHEFSLQIHQESWMDQCVDTFSEL